MRVNRLIRGVEALSWLTIAWLLVDLLPGRHYRRLIHRHSHEAPPLSRREPRRIAAAVRRAVQQVSRKLPFRSECVHRAIAAHRMLRSRGIDSELHFGVRRCAETGELLSHVWVTCGDLPVIGADQAAEFVRVGEFPLSQPRG